MLFHCKFNLHTLKVINVTASFYNVKSHFDFSISSHLSSSMVFFLNREQ